MSRVNRRSFLKLSALAGGGLSLGFALGGCSDSPAKLPAAAEGAVQPNAFIQLTPKGQLILQLHKAEMGQGVIESMTTLAGEELNWDPNTIAVQFAEFHPEFRDPEMMLMTTGGSSSLRTGMPIVREAAASLAHVLKAAAARHWSVDASRIVLQDGEVIYGDERMPVAALVPTAINEPLPESVTLKPAEQFRFIGKRSVRHDALKKSTGTADFGIDSGPKDAAVAVLVRCPYFGGKLKSFDAGELKQQADIIDVFEVNGGVAIVANGYWPARKAANSLSVEWSKGPLAGTSANTIREQQRAMLDNKSGLERLEKGEEPEAAGVTVVREYYAPILAHATMEPQNAVASVSGDGAEIWCPNQGPDGVQGAVANALGIAPADVTVHSCFLGGGFGRRLVPDYAVEAALISKAVDRPVRLIWSREDDTRHDFYRPPATVRFTAQLNNGRIESLRSKLVAPGIYASMTPWIAGAALPAWVPGAVPETIGSMVAYVDPPAGEGINDTDYEFGYQEARFVRQKLPLPLGFWRSVGHSHNGFFMESVMDELAHEAKADPLQFRIDHLPKDSPRRRLLDMIKAAGEWGNAPEGQFQGLAVHESFHTKVAQVATVSVNKGQIKVHRVYCAVDCGLAVNPDVVQAQIEGGIVFGLTAALKGEITLEDGRVQQSNFHDYQMMRMNEIPEVDVEVLASAEPPTGVGEPGLPPIAPAVANAVFAATGQRLRELPLRLANS